jgi:polyisoprenyl-phosphate glycosyltransferase
MGKGDIMKLISIVTPCYNEGENVESLYNAVKKILTRYPHYDYEHIFIDNASRDNTVDILKRLAISDNRLKVIINARNFGPNRSPLHAIFQAKGDAVIPLAADFQDPPQLIPDFLEKWEQGYKIVAAVKKQSEESPLMYSIRKAYYNLIAVLSENEQIKNFTGYGLYDRSVIEIIRDTGDHAPYWRGLVSEIGYDIARIEYIRPVRKRGFSKNRFYDLYNEAMTGITSQSKLPLRLATFIGFSMAILSILVAFGYLIYKLIYWKQFSVGTAPLVIGLFFFSSVQLIFLGIIGEYIGAIYSRVNQKWLVIERERINF